jgi:ABC-type transporter Mla subunit MlaD
MCPSAGKAKLGTWLQTVRDWIADMSARQTENKSLLDELHDDHNIFKSATDEIETAVEEIYDDHSVFKAAVDETKTLVDELYDDHATFKTAIDETKTLLDELHDDHATFKSVVDDVKSLLNNIRATLQGNYVAGLTGLSMGTTKTNVANDEFNYADSRKE